MPTPIELTLSSLLPTVSPLPAELIDLSTSLLSQSRSKAATLKPEEEIARTYACCHIACQRLGHRFALEIATPAPPVKPRVYQKLHSYFNSVLATPKQVARKKAATVFDDRIGRSKTVGGQSDGQAGSTPVGRKRPVEDRTKTPTAARKRVKRDENEMPHYVMPMIRHLCRAFDAAECAPHAYAGVQSLLYPSDGSSAIPPDSGGIAAHGLIECQLVSVFDTVYHRMYPPRNAKAKKAEHIRMTKEFRAYCQENKTIIRLDPDSDADGCNHPESWEEMEWFQNIPTARPEQDGSESPIRTEPPAKTPIRREKRGKKKDPDADEELGAAGLLPGLGTMFQPAIDWLSDERRAQYGQWRKDIAKQMVLTQQRV